MVAHVRAVTPEQYTEFIARRKREIASANREAARQREAQEQAAEEQGTEEATQPGEAGRLGTDSKMATTAAPTTTRLLEQPVPQITAHRVDAEPRGWRSWVTRPITSGSGSCTWSRRSCSSSSAASRRC
jgi:hypothetical protein